LVAFGNYSVKSPQNIPTHESSRHERVRSVFLLFVGYSGNGFTARRITTGWRPECQLLFAPTANTNNRLTLPNGPESNIKLCAKNVALN